MKKTARLWLGYTITTAALSLAGCVDGQPFEPNGNGSPETPPPTDANVSRADLGARPREVDLASCPKLRAPLGSELAFHAYARGVQIYRWSGASWTFVAPSAVLFADAGGNGVVGTHYAGPTWESNSGSKVVGSVAERCTPNPNAIPWLLLGAVSSDRPGVFARVSSIQRLNTVGGNAPSTPGSVVGEIANVPYEAEYFFYRQ